jgi:hypothetical protein
MAIKEEKNIREQSKVKKNIRTEYAIYCRDMNAILNSKHEEPSRGRENKSVIYLTHTPYHDYWEPKISFSPVDLFYPQCYLLEIYSEPSTLTPPWLLSQTNVGWKTLNRFLRGVSHDYHL